MGKNIAISFYKNMEYIADHPKLQYTFALLQAGFLLGWLAVQMLII